MKASLLLPLGLLEMKTGASFLKSATVAFSLLFAISFAMSFRLPCAQAATSKAAALKELREWRSRILSDDDRASSEQKKIVTNLSRLSLRAVSHRDADENVANQIVDQELTKPLDEIGRIDSDRVELDAQRRIVDQLIFAVDTKWSGADLRAFLETQLLDLAVTDLSEPGQGGWWKFLIQASISLREIAEPGCDPVKFLESYTVESGVLEPKSAFDVLKARKYIGQ